MLRPLPFPGYCVCASLLLCVCVCVWVYGRGWECVSSRCRAPVEMCQNVDSRTKMTVSTQTVITPQHSVVMYKTCVCLFICFFWLVTLVKNSVLSICPRNIEQMDLKCILNLRWDQIIWCVNVCVKGWMRALCKALWITVVKVLEKCYGNAVHLSLVKLRVHFWCILNFIWKLNIPNFLWVMLDWTSAKSNSTHIFILPVQSTKMSSDFWL